MLIKKVIEISDEDAISIVYRLGLITFRIAMIFTILREIENGKIGTNIICSDEDFGTCLILAEVYFEHSLVVYQSLSGNAARNSNYMSLFEFLPNEFTHKEAIKIGTVVAGFSTRTVENYLNKLKDSGLLKQKKRYGSYFK